MANKQVENRAAEHSEKFLFDEREAFLAKTLRTDKKQFFELLFSDIFRNPQPAKIEEAAAEAEEVKEASVQKKKTPLRHGLRGRYIVKVVEENGKRRAATLLREGGRLYYTDEKGRKLREQDEKEDTAHFKERPPHFAPAEKAGHSTQQPTSLISKALATQPLFGHQRKQGKDEEPVLIALAFPLDGQPTRESAARPHGVWGLYDGGSVARPNEFNSYQEAEHFRKQKYEELYPSLFVSQQALENALKENPKKQQHNEVPARLRWTKDCVGLIPHNNLPCRLAEAHFATVLEKYGTTVTRQKVSKPKIYFYTKDVKTYKEYTATDWEKDCRDANKQVSQILLEDAALDNAFQSDNFKFLLLGAEPKHVKEILESRAPANEGTTRLLELYMRGDVFYAYALADHAGLDLKAAIAAFDWPQVVKLHSNAIRDLALHYAILYLKLPSIIVNKRNKKGNTTLMNSAYYGKADEVTALLKHLEMKREEIQVALLSAIHGGHSAIANELLDKLLPADDDGGVLLLAIRQGQMGIAQRWLECLKHYPEDLSKALQLAAENGCVEIVKNMLLMVCYEDKYTTNKEVLRFAVDSGQATVVRLLLGAQCDSPYGQALLLALDQGHFEIASKWVTAHEDKLTAQAALQLAASHNCLALIPLMKLAVAFNPDEIQGALRAAVEMGHKEVVCLLGVDISAAFGQTLLLAMEKNPKELAIKWVGSAKEKAEAFAMAVQNNHVDLVKAMLKAGANPRYAVLDLAEQDRARVISALQKRDAHYSVAAENKAEEHETTADILLDHFCKSTDAQALRLALTRGKMDIVDSWFEHYRHIEFPGFYVDSGKWRPLSLAVEQGDEDIVSAFVASIVVTDKTERDFLAQVILKANREGHDAIRNKLADCYGQSAEDHLLRLAAQKNIVAILEYYVEKNAFYGDELLISVIEMQDPELLAALLELDAYSSCNSFRSFAENLIIKEGLLSLAEVLLKKARRETGNEVFLSIIRTGDQEMAKEMAMECKNHRGVAFFLEKAVERGYEDVVEAIMDCNPYYDLNDLETALRIAVNIKPNEKIAQRLLQEFAVRANNPDIENAIRRTIRRGDLKITALLLVKFGKSIDEEILKILQLIAKAEQQEMAQKWIAEGCPEDDLEGIPSSQFIALKLAVQGGHADIVIAMLYSELVSVRYPEENLLALVRPSADPDDPSCRIGQALVLAMLKEYIQERAPRARDAHRFGTNDSFFNQKKYSAGNKLEAATWFLAFLEEGAALDRFAEIQDTLEDSQLGKIVEAAKPWFPIRFAQIESHAVAASKHACVVS